MLAAHLSTGDLRVVGAPPLKKSAILSAHPLPQVPLIPMRRADGGYDYWADKQDPVYLAEQARVKAQRDKALWLLYLVDCLPDVVPPGDDAWVEELRHLGVCPRPGRAGRKQDWVEYHLVATSDDIQVLRHAFFQANEVTAEDRAAAEAFFNLCWDEVPVREAAQGIKEGKLSFASGYAEFLAAETWGLLPLRADEVPDDLLGRLPLLYYDLPPWLRARMEVFCELRVLAEALRADDAYRGVKRS